MSVLLPDRRVLNRTLTDTLKTEIVKFEVVPVAVGDRVRLSFESTDSPWRQGVWLGTRGALVIGATESPQVVVWGDSVSEPVVIEIACTDGFLRLYNVWDSGRGFGEFESQSYTSGMRLHSHANGTRYECNDIGLDPDFRKLVFRLDIERAEDEGCGVGTDAGDNRLDQP